ncbi:hypothetical protein ACFHYQ_08225 [Sphaerimonospora cavernae]|uniref:Type II toxin-antitoxin system RelE/ParE family toxin n=1 Tax=Sphaerimonospora cavernae TaxID=1740611 RepID=A0ABV6U1E4_9ACTN
MKFRRAAAFDRDFTRLPTEHQRLFLKALREHVLPAIGAGAFTGDPPWPARLRVHRLSDTAIYSITWHFSSPDGRATFHLGQNEEGEPMLVWRRIGDHSIYDRP